MANAAPRTAQLAVARAARQAAAVYRAVVDGPPAPAPAGWGVDATDFRKALPVLRWRELTVFATHFGSRGAVVAEVAAALAAEVGRRIAQAGCHARDGKPEGSAAGKAAAAATSAATQALELASSREVAAIVYAFSKLKPQLPEYAPVYAAVAEGVQRKTWALSRLQAGLIGTALADVRLHLADTLPGVLRPTLRRLAEEPESYAELTVDELRYLLHASAHLPSPGLTSQEVELLANCTQRLIGSANFARASHLAVAWLQLQPPPAAKEAHLGALYAASVQLRDQKPSPCAHPLPAEGLAPSFERLLARERHQDPPPLTPPKLREIAFGLERLSGAVRADAGAHHRALGFSDWARIAALIVEFCEGHGITSLQAEKQVGAKGILPSWAAQTLGHAVSRARAEGVEGAAPVDLASLLTLLQLLRRYWPRPPPDERFFTWAARQLVLYREAAGEEADDEMLAKLVGELVPRLPEVERGQLARLLLARRPAGWHASSTRGPLLEAAPAAAAAAAAETAGGAAPRLLLGARRPAEAQAWRPPDVSLAGGGSPSRAAAPAEHKAAGQRLWGLLSERAQSRVSAAPAQVPGLAPVSAHAAAALGAPAVAVAAVAAPGIEACEVAPATLAAVAAPAATAAPAEAAAVLAAEVAAPPSMPLPAVPPDVAELAARLEKALQRVEVLQARLEDREQRQAQPPEQEPLANLQQEALASLAREHGGFPSALGATAVRPGVGGEATLHLHRPFNFEAFRRANSPRLQAERLRVLVPPDHFPLWPLPRK